MASDSSVRRPAYLSLLRFVHDRNPFYLFSALSMFVGFRIILGAMNARPGDWKTLLGLIATLNLYEVVMIGLALFLIVHRGLRRDGWILLGIEALFLVDLTNLNAEFFTAMPRLGLVVNAVCLVLAMVKILVVVRLLGLELRLQTAVCIAVQMAFLLGLPGIFRLMRSSAATIDPLQIYGLWWIVALVIAGTAVFANRREMPAVAWRLYVLMPLISLMVHLAGENRVYWVHFQLANLAPVLLGVTFALNYTRRQWHPMILPASLAMVMVAVLISITPGIYERELSFRLARAIVSPLRISLVMSALVMMFLTVRHHSLMAAQGAGSALILASLGPTPLDMAGRARQIALSIYDFVRRLEPESDMQWGYVAIASAFLLLAIGAVVSLHKTEPPPLVAEALV